MMTFQKFVNDNLDALINWTNSWATRLFFFVCFRSLIEYWCSLFSVFNLSTTLSFIVFCFLYLSMCGLLIYCAFLLDHILDYYHYPCFPVGILLLWYSLFCLLLLLRHLYQPLLSQCHLFHLILVKLFFSLWLSC